MAGGSGGHLIPALVLAERLRFSGEDCWMLSTERPVDRLLKRAVPAGGEASPSMPWSTVNLERLTPVWRWIAPDYLARQARAIRQIRAVLQEVQPDVVVGFGGYLSAAAVLAARRVRIPAVLHEQNVVPGRANRWLAPLAQAVAVSFPETRSYLPRRVRVELTGNPVRTRPGGLGSEEACRAWGFDPVKPVLLVMGGSQGSRAINRLAVSIWAGLSEPERRGLQVLHLAGTLEAGQMEAEYNRLKMQARVFPFLYEMDRALAAATLAISRAGATAIAEMMAFRLPAVLIPYPHAGAHQMANAQWMRSMGGAVVLEERRLTPGALWKEVRTLLEGPVDRERMRQAMGSHADGSAADRLVALIHVIATPSEARGKQSR